MNNFDLVYKESIIKLQRHTVSTQVIFKIIFRDKQKPLVITRAFHSGAYKFWTSIPEGRQKEAEEIGELICEYFKSYK